MKMKHLISLAILLLPALSFAQDDMKRVVDLRGYWKFSIGDNPRWSSFEYNDHSWEKIFVPSPWENEGFSGFDGYAWYRITVDLKNINDQNLFLILGFIDDVDEVYLNGQMIGHSGSFPPNFYTAYNSFRKYYIPEDLINRNGKNLIAIRVFDTVLEGGIVKGDVGIYADKTLPNNTFLLEGNWKFREGDSQSWAREDYDDTHWQDIMVPSLWRSLKKTKVDGVAWYRKSVMLPESYKMDDLVLVMGRIDDFDETYFNGVLIGETNDHQPFGWSQSFNELRVYDIPKSLIKPEQINSIAVRVSDMGGDAGIYRGPLAIIPRSRLNELTNFRD
ncbi:MAG TPA: glycoside hydrolase [Cytophagales bacterium]|nr:glycoside hydrolase [Rickettsiales bacterium]HCX23550.1 glycoside hydrolase [Cytophagales bacterium]|tara:strand:- start:56 stop:1051 length:996 start_codon:yes stop_codon:yes gene_type:complete